MANRRYLEKNFQWFGIDKGNNSSAGRLNEFNVGGGDIRSIGGVGEVTGGAVAGVAEDSDDRPVIEVRVWGWARGRRQSRVMTGKKNLRLRNGGFNGFQKRNQKRNPKQDGGGGEGGAANGVFCHIGVREIEI